VFVVIGFDFDCSYCEMYWFFGCFYDMVKY